MWKDLIIDGLAMVLYIIEEEHSYKAAGRRSLHGLGTSKVDSVSLPMSN